MQTITTTQLRTKSSELIKSLEKGDSISLIHRSKIVGVIKPKAEPKALTRATSLRRKSAHTGSAPASGGLDKQIT